MKKAQPKTDEKQIVESMNQAAEQWNKGDLDGYMSLYDSWRTPFIFCRPVSIIAAAITRAKPLKKISREIQLVMTVSANKNLFSLQHCKITLTKKPAQAPVPFLPPFVF